MVRTALALPVIDEEMLAQNGLSANDVRRRMEAGLHNRIASDSSRSLWHILRGNLFTLFNAIVGGSFVLLLALGQWQDSLFGLAVIANVLIGVVQEYRAKRSLDKLAVVHAPKARVLRAGSVIEVAVADVVLDDILVLRAGDQVAADAKVLQADFLELDQSLLTGEADPASMTEQGEVLSGSAVIAGQGRARVVRVGTESFANALTQEAKRFSLVNSELRNALNRIVRWISWALIPLIALVVNGQMKALGGWAQAIESGSWRQGAVSAAASTISMIPQGLVLITSIAFALAAVKLARNQVLVQELPAVEGLARVDMVCLDKTGTLTDGTLVLDSVREVDTPSALGWREVLGWFGTDANANATARGLVVEFAGAEGLSPVTVIPFSSTRKWGSVAFDSGIAPGSWVLGAPETVLNTSVPDDSAVLNATAELAGAGLRTLVLAHSHHLLRESELAPQGLPRALRTVAIITFRERIRSDAKETLDYFREQGVALRIISGDNPRTVAAVARTVGLQFEGDGYDARDLPGDLSLMGDVLEDHHVFGRVTPTQKRDMVIALQNRGHVVAMTGDGVNDVLALKRADIGIAMGSGADATKAVSRLVLLDGQFSHLPIVVAEGRRVIANIELVSKLFLTKTVYAVLLALAFGLLLWEFPFLPRQLSAADGLTIGIPAFFLALLPNQCRYLPGFLRRSLAFSIPAGIAISLVILTVNTYSRVTVGNTQDSAQTASVLAVSVVGLWVLAVLIRPLNRSRALILASMYIGLLGCLIVPFLRDFFDLQLPTGDLLAVAIGTAIPGCVGIEITYRIQKRRNRASN
ncbi:HAD-IC family P-type ATPase [Cryobacterium sp. PH31-L1]|uniref:HAD-IC family P-type ATPase n=1 Tax=Cryobacterium sp. PH31-L1 TaxID=3046199 RepID=UPI0024BB9882|nr:HAD-IC family P-type ATPase [Cryobacterium sp. PH31-L1]MDJ0379002.1 HAD-IC family P-type ATPase [Cryobacterium sp. PH31-L1]